MEINDKNNKEIESIVEVQHDSKLTFDEQVIVKIVMMTLKDIEGVATIKPGGGAFSGIVGRTNNEGINVEVGETEVAVDLRLVIEYGKNAKEIYSEIKEAVENQVMNMTGLRVVELNVKIEDVLKADEFKTRG
ncbi:Asp23/Gls24 family envelope stress response protein [Peptostreptococcus faecalis]|uniref:Asp23/Gls24 family envelope stress response protein n=1 Tax=Peptostreptococcus faecalis TaxID=2045015 RepID=UPI001FA92BEA|nr:Asp23/Gls24 family envelope stress response protein [Peptostreptococcus faecalis]